MQTPQNTHEPVAYLNGEFLLHREATIPVWDLGIVQGVTVTEAVRTFRHLPFQLDDHLARLETSLKPLGLVLTESHAQLRHIFTQIVTYNSSLIAATGDLVALIFVTAGESPLHGAGSLRRPGQPTVCVYTRPINARASFDLYQRGLSLIVPSVRHIPASIIDPRIKYRSRLHWYLADREVQQQDPAAEALLLDTNGFVTETAKGNLFARFGDMLQTPHADTTLGGVSQLVVIELAQQAGIACLRSNLTPDELTRADEVWISSTTTCLVPVTRLNGHPIGNGQPGEVWKTLMGAWSNLVGMDIVGQAEISANEAAIC